MKILGFASKVVKCIFNTVEAYMSEIKADSFVLLCVTHHFFDINQNFELNRTNV